MRIVFISGLYPPQTKGGGEISTYLIAEGLKARGHEVEMITEENSRLGLLEKPLLEKRQSRKIAKKLEKILTGDHPRGVSKFHPGGGMPIIHAHDFRSALALSELELPNSVTTIRDYAPICGTTNNILADGNRCHCTFSDVLKTKRFQEVRFPRNYARAWQYWYNVPYRKEAFRKLKHQIFISRAQRAEISEQLDLEGINTQVIYNPVSDDYLKTPTQEGQKGSVLYVGRIEDYKGVGLLLEVWKNVAKAISHAHLTIVGEGAQKSDYEKFVAREGLQYRVTFKGKVPYERLRAEYDDAQIIIAPHMWTEPFGRTVAEAMARGKVVVSADTGGPAEMIQNDKTGILFKKGSVDELSTTLQHALASRPYDFKEIGHAAQSWVQQNLTIEKIAAQYEDFYREILERTSSTVSARMVS